MLRVVHEKTKFYLVLEISNVTSGHVIVCVYMNRNLRADRTILSLLIHSRNRSYWNMHVDASMV